MPTSTLAILALLAVRRRLRRRGGRSGSRPAAHRPHPGGGRPSPGRVGGPGYPLAGGPLDQHHEPQGRPPAGLGHLEADDPTHQLTVGRDDAGHGGKPHDAEPGTGKSRRRWRDTCCGGPPGDLDLSDKEAVSRLKAYTTRRK